VGVTLGAAEVRLSLSASHRAELVDSLLPRQVLRVVRLNTGELRVEQSAASTHLRLVVLVLEIAQVLLEGVISKLVPQGLGGRQGHNHSDDKEIGQHF
jgi:hypothetical protein